MVKQYVPGPFLVFWKTLTDWWDAWLSLMLINLAGALCILLILPGPPAIFAFYYTANELAHGHTIGLRDFADGMRRYFVVSWLWAIINFAFGFLAYNGFLFYGRLQNEFGTALQLLVLALALVWLIVQFYALPYLMEQQQKNLSRAWRNGLFTALASPLYTIQLVLLAVLIAAFNLILVLPMFLGGVFLFALLATNAVFERLQTLGIRDREAKQPSTHKEA